MAVKVCEDLNEILLSGGYEIRMLTEARARRATGFMGRPMTSRFPGTCAVCMAAIAEGEPILYDRDARRAAHQRCGEPSE